MVRFSVMTCRVMVSGPSALWTQAQKAEEKEEELKEEVEADEKEELKEVR